MRKKSHNTAKLSILFILDPLTKLNVPADTSMALLREFHDRGHQTWSVKIDDIWLTHNGVMGKTRQLRPESAAIFTVVKTTAQALKKFDLILIRKEPPFDERYLAMTYFMDFLKDEVFLSNHCDGIRNNNEKLSAFHFRKFMPKTMVTHSINQILEFSAKTPEGLVIKPLDMAGGSGVFKLSRQKEKAYKELLAATRHNKKIVTAQVFIKPHKGKRPSDKRVILLDGKICAVYERLCKPGEFRANLHKGGTFHKCLLTKTEEAMIKTMGAYLRKQGLHFVGLDIIQGKLIEINVTCPGGVLEAEMLYPQAKIIKKWADFLEKKVKQHHASR